MELIIKAGGDLSLQQNKGKTCLYKACENGQYDVVHCILKANNDLVNVPSNSGMMPIHIASQEGYNRCVERLIRSGADVNYKDEDGSSALELASLTGHLSVVDTLLLAGADVNIKNNRGRTPLWHAISRDKTNVALRYIYLMAEDTNWRMYIAHCGDKKVYDIRTFLRTLDISKGLLKKKPWDFCPRLYFLPQWKAHYERGHPSATEYRTLELTAESLKHNVPVQHELKLVRGLLDNLDGREFDIVKAIAIDNQGLTYRFSNALSTLTDRHKKFPQLFAKKDWHSMSGPKQRKATLDYLDSRYAIEPWNNDKTVKVLPAAHATKDAIVSSLCSGGFGTVASLDPGWYGQGVYFTTSVRYAAKYSNENVKAIVIALTLPGNTLPVIEDPFGMSSRAGQAIRAGYQSHYVRVDNKGNPCQSDSNTSMDELVIGQGIN